jgi:hypothetical protein
MPSPCQHSERLWSALQKNVEAYKEVIEKQFSAIRDRNLEFREFEKEIKAARRHLGSAKAAVINHHRAHRCHLRKNHNGERSAK